jgi:hypothetical protein
MWKIGGINSLMPQVKYGYHNELIFKQLMLAQHIFMELRQTIKSLTPSHRLVEDGGMYKAST